MFEGLAALLLALKEEGAMSQGTQVTPVRWKRQGNSPVPPEGNASLPAP